MKPRPQLVPQTAPVVQPDWPRIDCVVIGINCARTLAPCLASVKKADYPQDRIKIFYIDGGSKDTSVAVAAGFEGVTTVELTPEFPSPGLGRNRGWQRGAAPYVQFLDSDTLLDPDWLKKGAAALKDSAVGAVQGMRREIHPGRSVFNWIGDLEWNGPAGDADCFGGDVMIRRRTLEVTGGYDEVLVGGEDPELGRRVIHAGWRIVQLPDLMTRHDLAMHRIGQYLKRAFRSGYGFAAVREREASRKSSFWRHDMRKIMVRGGGFMLSLALGIAAVSTGVLPGALAGGICLGAGAALLFRPRLFLVDKFRRQHGLSARQARIYAWHCSLVVLPQLGGVLRFYLGIWLNRPLRNPGRTKTSSPSNNEMRSVL